MQKNELNKIVLVMSGQGVMAAVHMHLIWKIFLASSVTYLARIFSEAFLVAEAVREPEAAREREVQEAAIFVSSWN